MAVDIGFANLVAETFELKTKTGETVTEVCLLLRDKETGLAIQDVTTVRTAYDEITGEVTPDAVDCLVYADAYDENYTHKFTIERFVEEGA